MNAITFLFFYFFFVLKRKKKKQQKKKFFVNFFFLLVRFAYVNASKFVAFNFSIDTRVFSASK